MDNVTPVATEARISEKNGPGVDFTATATPPVSPPPSPIVKPVRKPKPKKPKPASKPKEPPLSEKKLLLEWFPELFWGERPYKWQFDALSCLGYRNSRVAVKAANGSGKTSKLVAAAIMWHMIRFPGSQTVCTAGVYRQVVDVLWPVIREKSGKMGGAEFGWEITENKIRYTPPEGAACREPALCVGFAATDAEKAEGWHARGPSENLLYVIDEAKGVSDQIFDAMERCQPTRVLEVSSPGGCSGRFYERFRKGDDRYDFFTVTAYDCPHITKAWINEQIAIYGEKSALVQSMIFAEFGEEDGSALILPPGVLQKCVSSPPQKTGTLKRAGCDFAAGGDENVIQVIEGNRVLETIKWREKDTMAAVGRYITEFKRLGLTAENIWADAGGLGIPMCDALREAGWDVHRVNNGEAARSDKFANRGTEMWVEFARMVETGRVILPEDPDLHRQLTTRRLEHNSKGKLIAEAKDKMRGRGLGSPDRADALVLAFCGAGQSFDSYMAKYGKGVSFADLDDEEGYRPDGGAMAGAHAG